MGIFGIAKKGFGRAVKAYKQKKIASGKSTREERIKYGERDPDFKVKKTTKSLKKSKAQAKMKSGTSTREERIKYGERSPDIKAVKPTKDIKGSIERGRSEEYLRRIRKLDKADEKVATGKKMMKEGQKTRKQMKDTGTAFQFKHSKSYHPIKPGDAKKYNIKKGMAQ